MKSPQPVRPSGPLGLIADVILAVALPLVIVANVADMAYDHRLSVGGLIVAILAATWLSEVERRRDWLRALVRRLR